MPNEYHAASSSCSILARLETLVLVWYSQVCTMTCGGFPKQADSNIDPQLIVLTLGTPK